MISNKQGMERREHPRVSNNIPIKIRLEDGDIVTDSGNISRSGVYCKVSKFIEPMTKLKVQLLLPIQKNGKSTSKKISCEGVIVRTEPIDNGEQCNVAIFFNDISQRDAEAIADYIGTYLELKTTD